VGLAVILGSLSGAKVVIQGYHSPFSAHEGNIERLFHSEHVYRLATLQEQSLTRLKGRGTEEALQTRPESVCDPDIAPELDSFPGDVAHGHPLH
jgi:hypothetical protein